MPIREYWEHRGLVRNGYEDEVPSAKESNLEEEWNKQGRHFFEQQQYEQVKLYNNIG